tara:strand:- start:86 stop:1600 length:1515 start_codon:yes stop_codon:yes gene_type:complete
VSNDTSKTPIAADKSRHWQVARADEFALIVDASDYFRLVRKVMLAAQTQLLLIGWDFDLEIEMMPGESDEDGLARDGLPNRLDAFIKEILNRNEKLEIYMLKWNGSLLVAPGRILPGAMLAAFHSERIHFSLDSHHPFGACHHQKIVVADDSVAFCGGIDMTEDRWDTSEHLPNDPRRVKKDGTPSEPWHDATSALSGPAAKALGDLARERWHRARGEVLDAPEGCDADIWPDDLAVEATDIDVAITRTAPPFDENPLINEIEQSLLYGIESAQECIYIESQYFACDSICDALEMRLREERGPQIVIINPKYALSDFEDDAMHEVRDRMLGRLVAADHEDRFRIYFPVNTADQPIYVHAKIFIVDRAALHIGSANINNRSMAFDTECNIVIEAQPDLIAGFRTRLLSEHLGVQPQEFEKALAEDGLIYAIETLNRPSGRGLRAIGDRTSNLRSRLLADTQIMNPRYHHGDDSNTGQGIRPRHIAAIAVGGIAGYLAWLKWRGKK